MAQNLKKYQDALNSISFTQGAQLSVPQKGTTAGEIQIGFPSKGPIVVIPNAISVQLTERQAIGNFVLNAPAYIKELMALVTKLDGKLTKLKTPPAGGAPPIPPDPQK